MEETMSDVTYRAICYTCDRTTFAKADPLDLAEGPPGVYRAANGQSCLKCEGCKETKHAVRHASPD